MAVESVQPFTCFRVYTFIPRVHGPIRLWKDSLLHIAKLGFNAIHLLPITQCGPAKSPYAAFDLFAIDEAYSETEDREEGFRIFKEFVGLCKEMHIALIVDLVFNNVGRESLMVSQHREWLVDDPTESDGIKRAGFSDGEMWHKWEDTALINYQPRQAPTKDALWQFMGRYALLWAEFAALADGGIRLDNLHSSDRDFILWVLQKIRASYPRLFVTGEYFGLEENIFTAVKEFRLDFILATPWEHKFAPELRRYIQYLHGLSGRVNYLFPVNSHDSGAIAEEFGNAQSAIPRLAVSALMGPGPWGITEGVEANVLKKIPFIGDIANNSVKSDQRTAKMISELNAFLQNHTQFQTSGNFQFVDDIHPAILAGLRFSPEKPAEIFCVAANMDTHGAQKCSIRNRSDFPEIHSWKIIHAWAFEPNDVSFFPLNDSLVLQMPPASAVILGGISRRFAP